MEHAAGWAEQAKDEAALSDYLAWHFRQDFAERAVVVNREVEIRRSGVSSLGERTDLTVAAGRVGDGAPISVIVEVKGCWNRNRDTDLADQLRDRYLRNNNACRHGLYVVGWFNCPGWDAADRRRRGAPAESIAWAHEHFADIARKAARPGIALHAVVLNVALR